MTTQKKLVSALLVTALSAGTINVAHAQDAEKPADTNVSASAEAADGKMKIAEIPVLEYTPKETQSPIKVNGTKDWDKALSLSPTENGDVTLNLNLGGQVPEGTKISLMDGSKELTSATVDSSGKVTLVAKDIPKQVKSLSLVASGDGVKGLQSVKCVADKGIDQKASEDATLEAIKKFETEYEEAWRNGYADGAKSKDVAHESAIKESSDSTEMTTRTVTTVVTEDPTVKDTEDKINETEKTTKDSIKEHVDPGTDNGIKEWFLKVIGPLAGGGIGLAVLGNVLGPVLGKISAQIPGLDLQGMDFNALLDKVNQFKIPAEWQNMLPDFKDPRWGQEGVDPCELLPKGDLQKGCKDAGKQATKILNDIKAQLKAQLDKVGGDNKELVAQIKAMIDGVKPEHVIGALLLPILITIAVKLIQKMPGKKPTTSTEKVPGKKETVKETVPGGKTTIPGAVKTLTTTVVEPVKTKTPNPDTPDKPTPGKPDLPTPPEFIEKELTKRDLPTKPEADGISFDIEVGSIVDCTAEVVPGGSTDKTTDKKTTEKTTDKNTVRENETTNDKRSKKLTTCEDVREYAASNNIPGGVAGIKKDHPMFNAALDTDGNGIMCDENGNPVNRPVQSPVVSTPGIGGSNPVITPGSGAAPAQPVAAQVPAAPVMAAVPNYGPKVDTGAEIDKGFVRSALEFLSLR